MKMAMTEKQWMEFESIQDNVASLNKRLEKLLLTVGNKNCALARRKERKGN